jgi:hypothetical protein
MREVRRGVPKTPRARGRLIAWEASITSENRGRNARRQVTIGRGVTGFRPESVNGLAIDGSFDLLPWQSTSEVTAAVLAELQRERNGGWR